jgi:hypothetical protein
MIVDDKLLREEYFPDDGHFKQFKCVITKEEFLECYNAWVSEDGARK